MYQRVEGRHVGIRGTEEVCQFRDPFPCLPDVLTCIEFTRHTVNHNLRFFGVTVVMAANRECGCQLPASKSISALVRGCFLQKTWLPHSLAPEGVIRTWNNLSVSGQGSNAATCRTCRVSLRRSELAVSFAQWIAVSVNLFVSYTSKWPPVLERKLKHQMLLPKMLFSSSLLDCRWTLFSKFVKSFRIHSSSNVNLQPRYLDIWILWTSCTLLGLPRPYELFS